MRVRRLIDNDMTFGQGLANFASDGEAVAQRVATRLRLLRGEWFLDLDAGVPYLQEIAVKPVNLPLAEALLKQCVLDTEGVDTINSWSMFYDSTARTLTVSGSVSTIYDTTENIGVTL